MLLAYNPTTRQWEEFIYFPETYHDDTHTWHWANGFVYWNNRWVHAWRTIDTTVTIPEVKGTYTYTRNSSGAVTQTVQWRSGTYDSTKCEIVNPEATQKSAAGTYTVYFRLKDRHSVWSDGTQGTKAVPWTIAKRVVTQPTATGSYTVTKTSASAFRTYTVSNGSGYSVDTNYGELVTASSTTSANKVGDYNLVFKLKDTQSSIWDNNKTTNITKQWHITTRTLYKPNQSGTLTYNGQEQQPTWDSNFNTYYMSKNVSGKTNAGTYSGTFSMLSDCQDQCVWWDGTASTSSITSNWTINKKSLAVPTTVSQYSTPLVYTGSTLYAINGAISGYDSNTMKVVSGGSATEAGQTNSVGSVSLIRHEAVIGLNDKTNYQWSVSPATSADQTVGWYIRRRTVSFGGGGYATFNSGETSGAYRNVLITSSADFGMYTREGGEANYTAYNSNTGGTRVFGYATANSGQTTNHTITAQLINTVTTYDNLTWDGAIVWTDLTVANNEYTNNLSSGTSLATAQDNYGNWVYRIYSYCKGSWQ